MSYGHLEERAVAHFRSRVGNAFSIKYTFVGSGNWIERASDWIMHRQKGDYSDFDKIRNSLTRPVDVEKLYLPVETHATPLGYNYSLTANGMRHLVTDRYVKGNKRVKKDKLICEPLRDWSVQFNKKLFDEMVESGIPYIRDCMIPAEIDGEQEDILETKVTGEKLKKKLRDWHGNRWEYYNDRKHNNHYCNPELQKDFKGCGLGITSLVWYGNKRILKAMPSVVQRFKKLEELVLAGSGVFGIENLDGLENLDWMSLKGNNIFSIEGLETLKNLKYLRLMENNIREFGGISTLINLREIDLSTNEMWKDFNIQEMSGLKKLREAKFNKNHLNKIWGNLFGMDELHTMSFVSNKITSLSNMQRIKSWVKLPRLKWLKMNENPFSETFAEEMREHYRKHDKKFYFN